MMIPFDKAALLAALQPKTTTLDIAGFGQVTLRQLRVAEVDALRANLKDNEARQFGLSLVMLSVVDGNGNPVFREADLPALQAVSHASLDPLLAAALELNGFKKVSDAKN